MNKSTLTLLFIGLASALFFSSTFLLNRYIALDGGHWFWSASLRYIYMLIFLLFGFIIFKGYDYLKDLLAEFFTNYIFWSVTGSIGFGIFYALISYVASESPAWVVATTWQFTIIASLIILTFFNKKISQVVKRLIWMVFLGIMIVNLGFMEIEDIQSQVFNIFLIIVAAFAYPIGNQMVWEVQNGRKSLPKVNHEIVKNTFSKVFLLSLGSIPFWIILSLFVDHGLPSINQAVNIIYVAIFSGIIATTLFLYARSKAKNSTQIAVVDATQSTEVIFTLVIEMLFLGVSLPSTLSLFGIVLVIVGLVWLCFANEN